MFQVNRGGMGGMDARSILETISFGLETGWQRLDEKYYTREVMDGKLQVVTANYTELHHDLKKDLGHLQEGVEEIKKNLTPKNEIEALTQRVKALETAHKTQFKRLLYMVGGITATLVSITILISYVGQHISIH